MIHMIPFCVMEGYSVNRRSCFVARYTNESRGTEHEPLLIQY